MNLAEIGKDLARVERNGQIAMSMDTVAGFESMQRIAKLFASSDIVPTQYRNNQANAFIAVDMALRMGANPLMVMQNLYIVHNNPAWSAQFLIATFNRSGRFSALRYEFQGTEGNDDWGCRAVAMELATREKLEGPLITIGMAKKEGWFSKQGSKWQSMPEQMLRYRAAAWFVRVYAPEIAMGLHTVEEENDRVITVDAVDVTDGRVSSLDGLQRREKEAMKAAPDAPEAEIVEAEAAPAVKQTEKPAETEEKQKPAEEEKKEGRKTRPLAQEKQFPCIKETENGEPKMVTREDCFYCPDNEGCPNRA